MMLPANLLIIISLKRWVKVEAGRGVIKDVGMENTDQNKEPNNGT